jgi:hypothetical protein
MRLKKQAWTPLTPPAALGENINKSPLYNTPLQRPATIASSTAMISVVEMEDCISKIVIESKEAEK